jgi:hypothetical protein
LKGNQESGTRKLTEYLGLDWDENCLSPHNKPKSVAAVSNLQVRRKVYIGAVDNESEFSTDWLARSECYMRTLRFKQANPSVGTLAICASKLQYYASCMTATERHAQLAKQFIELSERCHKQINADAVGWWKEEIRV